MFKPETGLLTLDFIGRSITNMAEWNKCWGGVRILKNDGLVDEYPKEHQDPGGPVPYMVL